eukprot:TRINITY_DN1041_c3_g1_i1.p1 TRINITY_DN1041_c3_g1~~TRINITY_DN1041_c3_g1_i1.p1  ORF type:complete len:267 (-),score=48.03 TRINITY_DN1041_c3_g1_i1:223-1023(-)
MAPIGKKGAGARACYSYLQSAGVGPADAAGEPSGRRVVEVARNSGGQASPPATTASGAGSLRDQLRQQGAVVLAALGVKPAGTRGGKRFQATEALRAAVFRSGAPRVSRESAAAAAPLAAQAQGPRAVGLQPQQQQQQHPEQQLMVPDGLDCTPIRTPVPGGPTMVACERQTKRLDDAKSRPRNAGIVDLRQASLAVAAAASSTFPEPMKIEMPPPKDAYWPLAQTDKTQPLKLSSGVAGVHTFGLGLEPSLALMQQLLASNWQLM